MVENGHESHGIESIKLTQPMDPEKKKSLNFIFPTKYVIPKSWKSLAQVRKHHLKNKHNVSQLTSIGGTMGLPLESGSSIASHKEPPLESTVIWCPKKHHEVGASSASFGGFYMILYVGVSKNSGKTPKMDGENNGKPENPIKMDDLGVPLCLETPICE